MKNNQGKENIITEKWIGRIVGILFIVFILAAVILIVDKVSSSAKNAYAQALEEQNKETYEMFYNSAFGMAEQKYHVSNDVKITIEDIRKVSELEVLQVSAIEYVFHEENNQVWTAVRGHGVYTVDLTLGEFIVDNARQYVLARIPQPKLNTVGLDYEYENYLFKDGVFNGSTSEGVNLAMEDLKRAQEQLQIKLTSMQEYYDEAEASARRLIEEMVKNFNAEVPELAVEVEFVD